MTDLGPWRLVERTRRLTWFAGQGMATVRAADGASQVVYRGFLSIPLRLRLGRQWVHIGDPGSYDGFLVDCYQGPDGATTKMFEVRTPDGGYRDFVHTLGPGELMNNSFVAVSPDGQWAISGEWFEMNRFLIFPMPILNPAAGGSDEDLPLAGLLQLDRPVRNVQGATFLSPTVLLCSTDDPGSDLWPSPRQVLQLDLARPLDGTSQTAAVTYVGPAPLESRCQGTFETEGIDYDDQTGDLRLAVIEPGRCDPLTSIYQYRRAV
jgi:hypothetical protein